MISRFSPLGDLCGQDTRGMAAVEFALIAPVLLLLTFGMAEVGIVLNQYLTLTNAAVVGAAQLAFSAGVDATPYTDAVNAIKAAAPNLTPLPITVLVNGMPCSSDTTCATALSTAQTGGAGSVTVTATYSCLAMNIVYNLLPGCTLTAQETQRVQ
jgi:Flp pilus assembly protein TadG